MEISQENSQKKCYTVETMSVLHICPVPLKLKIS